MKNFDIIITGISKQSAIAITLVLISIEGVKYVKIYSARNIVRILFDDNIVHSELLLNAIRKEKLDVELMNWNLT